MNNPIRRVWIPKTGEAPLQAKPATAAPMVPQAPAAPKTRNMLFDDLPAPEVEEKNSDSIWAEFDTLPPVGAPRK